MIIHSWAPIKNYKIRQSQYYKESILRLGDMFEVITANRWYEGNTKNDTKNLGSHIYKPIRVNSYILITELHHWD